MNQSKFVLAQLENRSDATSWRIEGGLRGVRMRKSFKTREEAAAEKTSLKIKALQTTAGMRQVTTTLGDEQAREAEALLKRKDEANWIDLSTRITCDASIRHTKSSALKKTSNTLSATIAARQNAH